MTQAEAPSEQPSPAPGRSFGQRLLGALRLDGSVYEEIAGDSAAIGQAFGVAAAAAAARAISAPSGAVSTQGFVWAAIVLGFWPAASASVWAFARALGHSASLARLLRACGFAMAPFLLLIADVLDITLVRVSVDFLCTALFLGAFVVAARAALGLSLGRAAFVILLAFLTLFLLSMVAMNLHVPRA